VPTAGFARVLVLVEALSGLATTALLIAYLPSLYRAYSQRENRLLRLDDLYFELRGWEEWCRRVRLPHRLPRPHPVPLAAT